MRQGWAARAAAALLLALTLVSTALARPADIQPTGGIIAPTGPPPAAVDGGPPRQTDPARERIWLGIADSTGAGDLAALVAFRDGLESRGTLKGPEWLPNSPPPPSACIGGASSWDGVTCAAGRVVGLDLRGRGLQGPLSPALGRLSALRTLDLAGNALTGPLPPEWGALRDLTSLDLQRNNLTGVLPPAWAGLASLSTLRLNLNRLRGELPPAWGPGLTSLAALDLSQNFYIRGPLPADWRGLGNLTQLYVWGTGVSGGLPPEWGDASAFRALEYLSLHNNTLEGRLPPSWFGADAFPRLRYLTLEQNKLVGPLPNVSASALLDSGGTVTLDPQRPGYGLCGPIPDGFPATDAGGGGEPLYEFPRRCGRGEVAGSNALPGTRGLSGGAVAGMAVGAAVGTAALVAGGLAAAEAARRRRAAAVKAAVAAELKAAAAAAAAARAAALSPKPGMPGKPGGGGGAPPRASSGSGGGTPRVPARPAGGLGPPRPALAPDRRPEGPDPELASTLAPPSPWTAIQAFVRKASGTLAGGGGGGGGGGSGAGSGALRSQRSGALSVEPGGGGSTRAPSGAGEDGAPPPPPPAPAAQHPASPGAVTPPASAFGSARRPGPAAPPLPPPTGDLPALPALGPSAANTSSGSGEAGTRRLLGRVRRSNTS